MCTDLLKVVKWGCVALRYILSLGNNPQIPRHMQAAKIFMNQRPNMVHVMRYASVVGQSPRLGVNLTDGLLIDPWWCRN